MDFMTFYYKDKWQTDTIRGKKLETPVKVECNTTLHEIKTDKLECRKIAAI